MQPDEQGERIRVILVEDESLYRDLLRTSLAQQRRLHVVGAFPNGESALDAAPALRPQVAILDIELGGGLNGIQTGLQLRQLLPDVGIVLLSNHRDPQTISSIPRDAISGWSYILKKSVSDVEALSRAIEGAASGFLVLDPELTRHMKPKGDGILARLTPRQREILALIAQGFTNAAIADKLVLSVKSVENQINLLYQQLGIDRADNKLQPRVTAVLGFLQESRSLSP